MTTGAGEPAPAQSKPDSAWLVDSAGRATEAGPADVDALVHEGTFFWLDLQGSREEGLADFSKRLGLSGDDIVKLVHSSARSSFTVTEKSVRAVIPAAVDADSTIWLDANYVTVVLNDRFLFTVHGPPCAALAEVRKRYRALGGEQREDRAQVLFLLLDILMGTFRSQLLALDDRLGEIQVGMLGGALPDVHDELVQILGILTDGIQELGWYSHDLEEVEDTLDQLPGMGSGWHEHFDRHVQRNERLKENANDIRQEAKDALGQYASVVAGRQAQVLASLTVVATVFLPLSFLTGYFGMNFTTLTGHAQSSFWEFLLLGLLLPLVCAGTSLLLITRLEHRFGIGRTQPRSG